MNAPKSSTTLMEMPRSERPAMTGLGSKAVRNGLKTAGLYIVILVMGALTLVPFLWMLSTSLKMREQLYAFPPEWIPSPVTFESYRVLFDPLPFDVFFLNSLQVALLSLGGTLLACSLAAYAFARL